MWLMALIAVVYLIIAVGQFMPKAKLVAISLSVCIALFGALCLCNVNQVVARYNIDRYLDGTLQSVDVELIKEMGDSVTAEVVRYIQIMDDSNRRQTPTYAQLKAYLRSEAAKMQEQELSIFQWNIPHHQARQALIHCGMLEQ